MMRYKNRLLQALISHFCIAEETNRQSLSNEERMNQQVPALVSSDISIRFYLSFLKSFILFPTSRWLTKPTIVFPDSVRALTSFHIAIPSAVVRGRSAVLACLYDLEGQPLYTLKWYKGNREFYRYTPRDDPPIKVFPIDGLTVNEHVSNDTHVLLENVSGEGGGKYSCELSADAPSFITKMETGTLNVSLKNLEILTNFLWSCFDLLLLFGSAVFYCCGGVVKSQYFYRI